MKTTSAERRRAEALLIKLGWDKLTIRAYGPAEEAMEHVIKALRLAEKRGWRRGIEDS